MSDDLITSLRALAAARHADLSIAVDAVIEIEQLRSQVEAVNLLKAEITLLRKALEPLAQHYLWPDDLGEDFASLIRSDDDWSEEANEDADSDVFIKRKYIRAARHALEGKP